MLFRYFCQETRVYQFQTVRESQEIANKFSHQELRQSKGEGEITSGQTIWILLTSSLWTMAWNVTNVSDKLRRSQSNEVAGMGSDLQNDFIPTRILARITKRKLCAVKYGESLELSIL